MVAQVLGFMLLLAIWPGAVYAGERPSREDLASEAPGPPLVAQLKPHERGNCFQWPNCRGDSIGATWIGDPDICKAWGGKSWMAPDRKCYNLPGGPHNIQGP